MRRTLLTIAVVKFAAVGLYAVILRERQLRWGAGPSEAAAPLPGDGLIPAPDLSATRAITVPAPVQDVWPWLAQLGQGRGGFYSYDWLENLAGCEVSSADRIVPEWQDVSVGDDFRLHPELTLTVVEVDPPHALVVAGLTPPDQPEGAGAPPYDFSWAFVLSGGGPGATRLVVRERYGYRTRWAQLVVEPVSLVSFVMTQRMLRGIRDRAGSQVPAGAGLSGDGPG